MYVEYYRTGFNKHIILKLFLNLTSVVYDFLTKLHLLLGNIFFCVCNLTLHGNEKSCFLAIFNIIFCTFSWVRSDSNIINIVSQTNGYLCKLLILLLNCTGPILDWRFYLFTIHHTLTIYVTGYCVVKLSGQNYLDFNAFLKLWLVSAHISICVQQGFELCVLHGFELNIVRIRFVVVIFRIRYTK